MSEANKAVVSRLIDEAWNNGNLSVVDDCVARSFVNHDPQNPGVQGPDGYKQLIMKYRNAFPDCRLSIDQTLCDGDWVVTRYTGTGTHRGDLEGIAPSGRAVSVTGTFTSRIVNDQLQESHVNWDTLGLLQQIGAVPARTRTAGA